MKRDIFTKLKALVVDDNEVNALVLSNMLSFFHIIVDEAYCGKDAIELSIKNNYDFIFIDHLMPDMDGITTTRGIREFGVDQENTAIFALTGNVTNQLKEVYRAAGANEVFEKPLDINNLTLILKDLIDHDNKEYTKIQASEKLKFDYQLMKKMLNEFPEINFEIGLKYAMGNLSQYIQMLRVALKDIKGSNEKIINSQKLMNYDDMRYCVHNLKSIFSNIGVIHLSEASIKLEQLILAQENFTVLDPYLTTYIEQLHRICVTIDQILLRFDELKEIKSCSSTEHKITQLTSQEYEQSLLNTIYYIKRYEYDSILMELNKLISAEHPMGLKEELVKAYKEIEDFKYDSALIRITQCLR